MNLSAFLARQRLSRLRIITASETFVAPQAGLYRFYAWGGGGSGGVAIRQGTATPKAVATGGGSGGFALIEKTLTAGTSFAITIGAGGAAAAYGGSNTVTGNAGSATTFTVGGTAVSAGGGSGGAGGSSTGSDYNANVSGGTGGTSTGGSINISGNQANSFVSYLSGGAIARATAGAPALIGPSLSVVPQTASELVRRYPTNPKIALLGSESALIDAELLWPSQTFPVDILTDYVWDSINGGFGASGAGGEAYASSGTISPANGNGVGYGAGGGGLADASIAAFGSITLTSGAGASGCVIAEYIG